MVSLLVLNSASQGLPGLPKGNPFEHFKNDKVANCGLRIGRWFERHAPAGSTLATNTAGSIPYVASRLRVIDMLGLTDATIARLDSGVGRGYVGHERYDADYVLGRKPDYILLCFSCATAQPCLPSCHALAERAEFKIRYRRREVEQEGFRFVVFQRRPPPPKRSGQAVRR